MLFEHKGLKEHKEALRLAIESGSEIKTKRVLEIHGKIIIQKLRSHIEAEDNKKKQRNKMQEEKKKKQSCSKHLNNLLRSQ